MREPPKLADSEIAAVLREHFGISGAAPAFLPLGEDSATAVYRVDAADGVVYLLKTRREDGFNPASLAVPRQLRNMGMPHIVARLPTASKALWAMLNGCALTLYPFIDGRIGGDAGLSEAQWIELGRTIRRIHRVELPPEVMSLVPRDGFVPSQRRIVDDLMRAIGGSAPADPVQRELAAFWNPRAEQIRTLVNRADALGRNLRDASLPLVLCHGDLHTRNLLLEGKERFWIVDWDEAMLAPKERDLMFFVGGITRKLLSPHHTELFPRLRQNGNRSRCAGLLSLCVGGPGHRRLRQGHFFLARSQRRLKTPRAPPFQATLRPREHRLDRAEAGGRFARRGRLTRAAST